jgi:flagellar biosynthetic protein FliS
MNPLIKNPYTAYQQQGIASLTRIDLILALHDGAIERLEQAMAALKQNTAADVQPFLKKAELGVLGLANGVDPSAGELQITLLRLYEFVIHCMKEGSPEKLESALQVLQTLRSGYQEVRPEAVRLEREGAIPPIDSVRLLQTTA